MSSKVKILALCDSPTITTGFARVAQNLFKRWHDKAGAAIDVWGIGFVGWHYRQAPYVDNLFPAYVHGHWSDTQRLELFLTQLQTGGYTHVWILQDTFMLSAKNFPETLKKVCDAGGIRSMLYFPVDAPLEPAWCEIIEAVDVAVAYTEYGKAEALAYVKGKEIAVIPHGVDTRVYRPLPLSRGELRKKLWTTPWLDEKDFLMLNVNVHQRRKDVTRSLEILAELKRGGPPAGGGRWKLLMHMGETSGEGVSLEAVARQLGLEIHEDWGHHDAFFRQGNATLGEETLVEIYNAADLYLTTTLGEGWGLGITEALACGCGIAAPLHTSCQEILTMVERVGGPLLAQRLVGLPLEAHGAVADMDNSRWRRRVRVAEAANLIRDYQAAGYSPEGMMWRHRLPLMDWPKVEQWLSWDRVAGEMWRRLTAEKKTPVKQTPSSKDQAPEKPQEPNIETHQTV